MPRFALSLALLFTVIFSVSFQIFAQEAVKKEYVKIILIDDTELTGTILSQDSTSIELLTMSNLNFMIKRSQISGIKVITDQIIKDVYFPEDPNQTRLLFAPTAKPLKAGKGYFALYELVFPFLGYGVGDFLTLSGGMTLFPGAETQILYLAPKATLYNTQKFSFATGVIHFTPTSNASLSGDEKAGIIYGVGTYSAERVDVTGGFGWAYAGEEITNKPIVMGAIELRASRYVKVIAETWFPPDMEVGVGGLGVRIFGRNFAGDIAFLYLIGQDAGSFPLIPWVSLVYNFGN